jgi:hypothetical protein
MHLRAADGNRLGIFVDDVQVKIWICLLMRCQ